MARLAVLLALAVTVASCGGSDAPSEDEYARQLNQTCRDLEKRLGNLGENAESPEQIADAIDRVIEETQDGVDRLADLERPEGDAGQTAEDFVGALRSEVEEKGVPALEDLRDAVKDGDQGRAAEASKRLESLDTGESDRLARELGAQDCVE